MEENPRLFWILIMVVILIIAGAGFWYFGGDVPFIGQKEEGTAVEVEVKDGLGAEALKKTNNPLSGELPETNPFQVNTNPFK